MIVFICSMEENVHCSETEAVINDISKADAPVAVGGIYQTANLLSHFDASFAHMEDCASFISLTSIALPK